VWSLSQGPYSPESPLVSQKHIQSLVNEVVEPMQSSIYPTLLLDCDVSTDHVLSQPIQPIFYEVVNSMQSLVDPTLLLESDKSTKVV
jgi:hypothetical protein